MGDGVVAEVGVEGDEREGLLEAAQRAHQPLLLRLGEDAHVLPRIQVHISVTLNPASIFNVAIKFLNHAKGSARLLQAYRHVEKN